MCVGFGGDPGSRHTVLPGHCERSGGTEGLQPQEISHSARGEGRQQNELNAEASRINTIFESIQLNQIVETNLKISLHSIN